MPKTLLLELPLPMLLSLIAFILIAFLSIIFLKIKIGSTKGFKLPPTPPKLPIIGNLHQLGKLPHQSLSELSQKYGPIMLLHLGYVPTLVISSPEAAKEVLKTHDLDTCTRPKSPGIRKFSYGYLNISFSAYGDYWREIRKIFTVELMTVKRIRLSCQAVDEEVTHLIEFLSQNSGKPIELDAKVYELADGVVANVALGKFRGRDQFGGRKFPDVLKEAMGMVGSFSVEDFFPTWWGRAMDRVVGHGSRLDKPFRDLDRYIQMVLDKHRSPERVVQIDHEDFVDVLVSLQRDPINSLTLTDSNIKAIIMDIFLATTETTPITILWAMSELMKNPRVMNKVQAEIRGCIGRKPKVEPDDIMNLKYLKMVVKETLRLHPPAPLLIPRETVRHCRIGNYDVLQGTRIYINAWAIGRDSSSWESPDEFNPDRFEGKEIDFKGQNFELLPFGSGRRMCPGIAMGVATVEFALANLLYCFDWELPEGMKFEEMSMEEEVGGLTVHRKDLLRVVPIRYQMNDGIHN